MVYQDKYYHQLSAYLDLSLCFVKISYNTHNIEPY